MVYVLYRDRDNQWRWQLLAANNKIVANSGEGYWNKADCIAGIHLTANSKGAPIRER